MGFKRWLSKIKLWSLRCLTHASEFFRPRTVTESVIIERPVDMSLGQNLHQPLINNEEIDIRSRTEIPNGIYMSELNYQTPPDSFTELDTNSQLDNSSDSPFVNIPPNPSSLSSPSLSSPSLSSPPSNPSSPPPSYPLPSSPSHPSPPFLYSPPSSPTQSSIDLSEEYRDYQLIHNELYQISQSS